MTILTQKNQTRYREHGVLEVCLIERRTETQSLHWHNPPITPMHIQLEERELWYGAGQGSRYHLYDPSSMSTRVQEIEKLR